MHLLENTSKFASNFMSLRMLQRAKPPTGLESINRKVLKILQFYVKNVCSEYNGAVLNADCPSNHGFLWSTLFTFNCVSGCLTHSSHSL